MKLKKICGSGVRTGSCISFLYIIWELVSKTCNVTVCQASFMTSEVIVYTSMTEVRPYELPLSSENNVQFKKIWNISGFYVYILHMISEITSKIKSCYILRRLRWSKMFIVSFYQCSIVILSKVKTNSCNEAASLFSSL